MYRLEGGHRVSEREEGGGSSVNQNVAHLPVYVCMGMRGGGGVLTTRTPPLGSTPADENNNATGKNTYQVGEERMRPYIYFPIYYWVIR